MLTMPQEIGPERRLGSLEARVVRDLWHHGESTVAEVLERLNREGRRQLAYNSVMSVMARLADKEILARHKDGRAYRYVAALQPHELASHLARREVRALLADFGEAAVAGFVSEADHDARLRDQIREWLAHDTAGEPDGRE